MKNYPKKWVFILLPIAIITVLSGCKKGEDDPFISLMSRKSRVAGEWKISKSISTSTYGSPAVTCTTTYDGNTESKTCGSGNPSTSVILNEVTFEKDGTFKWHLEKTPTGGAKVTSDYEGTWNFTCGVGDVKSKEQIAFTFTKWTTIDASGSSTATINSNLYNVYDITQLKNKEMALHAKSDNSYSANGSSGNSSSEETITLTAK